MIIPHLSTNYPRGRLKRKGARYDHETNRLLYRSCPYFELQPGGGCIEVAHTLNFSRAADNLFVSQPTFSYQIRLLEEEIGFTIFERNGKGAALTPAGAQFVTFLTSMREDLKRAIEQGQNFSAKYKDSISISLMVGSVFPA